jgi:chromosome segregation ATPase
MPWPEWRNGRRDGFKIRCPKGRVGSSPTSGTQVIHTLTPMGQRLLQRKLAQASGRLRELRNELRVVEDQKIQLVDEADELSLRALVAETPAAEFEYREAKKHADALVRHHARLVKEIHETEQRINDLLDRMKEVR